MTDFEKKIISELKQELEFKEINSDYSQWLQGVSLPTIIERKNNHLSLTARVVETRGRFACHIVRNEIFPHAEKSMRICLENFAVVAVAVSFCLFPISYTTFPSRKLTEESKFSNQSIFFVP